MKDEKIDYTKLKLADGWYLLRDGIVINRSDAHCPALIGSKLYGRSPGLGIPIGEENPDIKLFHHSDVLAWMEPEK